MYLKSGKIVKKPYFVKGHVSLVVNNKKQKLSFILSSI